MYRFFIDVQRHNTGTSLVANRNLDIVVDSYIHGLFAENPRIRYVCGWDARLLFIPMSFMPSRLQDLIIQFMMDLTSHSIKPAILQNNNDIKFNRNKMSGVASAS